MQIYSTTAVESHTVCFFRDIVTPQHILQTSDKENIIKK